MLVLTRKSNEKIVIGKQKQIVVTILKIQGDKVSIGIEAPDDEPIMRKELLLRDSEKPIDKINEAEARRKNKEALLQLQAKANSEASLAGAISGLGEGNNDTSST